MKVTNQACLQFLTTATTAMATVLAQRDDGNGVISPITKPNNGQDNIIDQRPNQKTPSFFNDGDESSSLTFGHNKVTTSTTGSSSFPNNDKVLRNQSMKPCRDTQRIQGINNKDADTGILECGVNEYCLVHADEYNNGNKGIGRCVDKTFLLSSSVHRSNELQSVETPEVHQSRRRLVDYVCPPTMTSNCPMSPVSLVSGDTLSCTANEACGAVCFVVTTVYGYGYGGKKGGGGYDYLDPYFEVEFASESSITCSAVLACCSIDVTGAGTMTCTERISCAFAAVALQNGGQLECDFEEACFGAEVSFEGTARMRCLTADACVSPSGSNNIYAAASGGTLLCRAENSCLTNFDLNDLSFLLICEDSFSCSSNASNPVVGTENTCVVCVQANSCTNLDGNFPIGANKNEAQIAGICTPDQIATMCNEIRPELAFNLDFGNGPVCTSSSPSTSLQPSTPPSTSLQPSTLPSTSLQPSTSPSTSLQPSMSPSDIPTDSYQPSMAPSVPPSTSPQPSLAPSKTPTTSPQPSLAPSVIPSSGPSITPSQTPTTSIQTSVVPTKPPTTSLQPSLAPSDMPNTMSKPSPMSRPSLAPFKTPGTGKNGGQKDGNGKKGGSGGKKGVNGGKKRHPNTGSNKAKIAKVENIVMREP